MIVASQAHKTLTAWLAAAVIGAGALTFASPAESRMGGFGGFHGGMGRFGGFHGGMGGFGGFGGFHRPFLMHRGFAGRGLVGHPGFFGHRFAHRPFFFHRHHGFGNAFAVGLVSGAALGTLAYPYSDYPYYSAAYEEDCYVVRRRIVTAWGGIVVKRKVVCT